MLLAIVKLFLFISILLKIVSAQPRPIRIDPVVIGAESVSGSCPSSDALESARRNTSRQVQLALNLSSTCGAGNWRQVADLDLGSASQQCSSPWVEVSNPARSCSSPTASGAGCEGVSFPVSGVSYSRVCGRAVGYSGITPDAFADLFDHAQGNIDNAYLDGISVTYGLPRQHIWSFGAGYGRDFFRCPCDTQDRNAAPLPPSFVGENYFCDGEYNGALWDGEDCTTNCCTFNSPPWFSVSLPTPTSDDIEVRICSDEGTANEYTHLQFLQIFVQ